MVHPKYKELLAKQEELITRKNVVKQDFELIEPTLDKSEKDQGLYKMLAESVECFGITDFDTIRNASKEGWKLFNNFQTMMRNGIPYKDALKNALKGKVVLSSDSSDFPISIALVAHGYDVLDDQASMKIFDKKVWYTVFRGVAIYYPSLSCLFSSIAFKMSFPQDSLTTCAF